MIISHWIVLGMKDVSDKFVEKIKTHFTFNNFYFSKIVPLWCNVETLGRSRQARNHNIMQCMCFACWMLRLQTTLRLCKTHCFSTGKMVTRTYFNVKLYYIGCLFYVCIYESEFLRMTDGYFWLNSKAWNTSDPVFLWYCEEMSNLQSNWGTVSMYRWQDMMVAEPVSTTQNNTSP